MSASAMLLHRALLKPGNRGWKSGDDRGRELTQTASQGVGPLGWNSLQNQHVNTDSRGNPDAHESPHYSPTEHQKDRHG